MEWIVFALIILAAGCEKISNEEAQFIGRWVWHVEVDGFLETGYLELREDRTYSYLVEWGTPTELTSISAPGKNHHSWRLNNESICLSKKIENKKVIEEDCLWHIRDDGDIQPYLVLNGTVINGEIKITRELQDGV